MEEVIHECDLRPKWVLGEVDDDVVALTGDHVEAAHRDWSFEKSTIGCDDLEWRAVAQVEIIVTSLCCAEEAEAILTCSDIEVWLYLAIDAK